MKTKKILAILISCLLLIGVAVGFTASAADETTVNIVAANVSYDGATRILYTVDAQNLASGSKVQIVFSSDENVAAPTGKLDAAAYDFVSASFGNLTVGGKTYKAVYSDGFEPAEINKKVYAIPVVTDADDNVVATGNKVGFSVCDYLMTRLAGEYTPEQYLLYIATLDFSGAVQYAEKVTEGVDPANGYSDAYYILKVEDGSGEVTTYAYREPTDVSLKAPKGYNGKLFESFVDASGAEYTDADFNIYNFKLDTIGTTYVKYVYGDTEISMEGITASSGNSASIANPDTSVVVKGGAEYYLEADVTLADDTVAALDFMANETAMIGTINLTEAAGVVTVSDGITSFEMANGSALRVEYVVISTSANTGTLFYYVNNEYVAKTDVPAVEGASNASFASVVARATAGEIVLEYATVGAKDGVIAFTTTSVSSVVYDYDATYGKYFWYNKTSDAADGGKFTFDITDAVQDTSTTTFEAKVKLTSNFIAAGTWRNAITINLRTEAGKGNTNDAEGRYNYINQNIAFTPTALHYGGAANGGTQYPITNPIAANEWFDLKIEHVGNKSFTIYINGEAVYAVTSGTSATDILNLTPSSGGAGSIYMADVKYTNK